MSRKHIHSKSRLSQAITLAIASGILGAGSNALAQKGGARILEEVIVTATKRAENLQDIPVTVQALTAETLDNQDINNFTDYIQKLPNVNFAGRGPGQNDVFIRGMAVGRGSLFQSGGIGAGPTVAFYVDEAPLTSSGRNLDMYVTDIKRLEVLPGPQGTLYGSSSMAGTYRLVTNQPDLSEFDAKIELTGAFTEGGEASWGVEGFVNIPIIEDRLAVRLVGYNSEQGGYIDNVPGTRDFSFNADIISGAKTLAPGAVLRQASNDSLVEDDINETQYVGGRIEAKLIINDNWDLTAGFITQDLHIDGVFDFSPDVGDLKVQRFNDDFLDDEFDQAHWVLNGRIEAVPLVGALDIVYAGSYLHREVEQLIDYVGGNSFGFSTFYNCAYNAAGEITLCAAPDARFRGFQDSNDVQHELRISTDPAKPLRFIGGVWYAKSHAGVSQEWEYHSPQLPGIDFAPNAPLSTQASFFNPNTRDPEVAFFNDLVPHSDQIAGFGELTYDLGHAWGALEGLSFTVGLRYFNINVVPKGSVNFASSGPVDTDSGTLVDTLGKESEDDLIKKFTLSYTPIEDLLLYFTFSEGFRQGGFNRGGDVFNATTGEFVAPAFFTSDSVNNFEGGVKTTLLDGRLRFNGSGYFIDWSDIQIDIFDPAISFLLFTANSGEAEIIGGEGDFTFLVTDNLTLSGAFSVNFTELTKGAANLEPVGSDLPLTPKFQSNVNLRYDFQPIAGIEPYAQFSIRYAGDTFTTLQTSNKQDLDSYVIADASIGMKMDQWSLRLFVNNLTDKRSELFKTIQDVGVTPARTVTSRPRTVSLRLSYDF